MTEAAGPLALLGIAAALKARHRAFAVVGGLAVSVRSEPRFTRDVDVAVVVANDAEAESLVRDLAVAGYRPQATVEDDSIKRLSTARLLSPQGVTVDLLFASSGIEAEIVTRATDVDIPLVGTLRVARTEELIAMKVLSMREDRMQDRIDAQLLIRHAPNLDLGVVRADLELIASRGYHRNQDLLAKLAAVVEEATRPTR